MEERKRKPVLDHAQSLLSFISIPFAFGLVISIFRYNSFSALSCITKRKKREREEKVTKAGKEVGRIGKSIGREVLPC